MAYRHKSQANTMASMDLVDSLSSFVVQITTHQILYLNAQRKVCKSLPLRVRSGKGMENLEVADYMEKCEGRWTKMHNNRNKHIQSAHIKIMERCL